MVLLHCKLFWAQCEEGGNIEEHVRTLWGYQQEYNSLSPTSPLSDEDFSITMLTSLPDTWNTFISAIDSTALSNLNTLIVQILEEDRRLRSKGDPNTSLAAREKPKKTKYNLNVTCYNCGKKGHIKPDCRSPKKEGAEEPKSGTKPKAYSAEEANRTSAGVEGVVM